MNIRLMICGPKSIFYPILLNLAGKTLKKAMRLFSRNMTYYFSANQVDPKTLEPHQSV